MSVHEAGRFHRDTKSPTDTKGHKRRPIFDQLWLRIPPLRYELGGLREAILACAHSVSTAKQNVAHGW